MKRILLSSLLYSLAWTSQTQGLPINFGINQRGIEYKQLMGENFSVYFDSRVKNEGSMILNSLEAAKPLLEKWFGIAREGDPLPVVSSAVTSEASFANFFMDQIELQTLGQFERDLAWHEYTHTTMYLHFKNIFGTPGAILNLIWMPSWYIEGLAESISVSSRSSRQMMLERYQALSGNWPSFDKLHSLYTDARWAATGYPTVGAFVRWFTLKALKKSQDSAFLNRFLQDFRSLSNPWWWPWAAIPWNGFMPFDKALQNELNMNGEKLWESYKEEAGQFWKSHRTGKLLTESKDQRLLLPSIGSLASEGNNLFTYTRDSMGNLQKEEIQFHQTSDWAISKKLANDLHSKNTSYFSNFKNQQIELYVKDGKRSSSHTYLDDLMARLPGKDQWKRITTVRNLERIIDVGERIAWVGGHLEDTWFCFLTVQDIKKHLESSSNAILQPNCRLKATLPKTISYLGTKFRDTPQSSQIAQDVWFKSTEQTLLGDRYEVIVWHAQSNSIEKLDWNLATEPIAVAFAGNKTWALVADGLTQTIWQIDSRGKCSEILPFDDRIISLLGQLDGSLVLGLYEGGAYSLKKVNPDHETKLHCIPSMGHLSPLLYALRKQSLSKGPTDSKLARDSTLQSQMPDFKESMLANDLWNKFDGFRNDLMKESSQSSEFQPIGPPNVEPSIDREFKDGIPSIASSTARDLMASNETLPPLTPTVERANSSVETESPPHSVPVLETEKAIETAVPLNIASPKIEGTSSESNGGSTEAAGIVSEPYRWKGRPALLFPWIGGDDAMGTQFGIISVPLVDSLQNETLRATMLFGAKSHFPSIDLTLTSTRYKPTLSLSIYKKQTYNGVIYTSPTSDGTLSYYDELGSRFELADQIDVFDHYWNYALGIRIANLKTLYGPELSRIGNLVEPGGNLGTAIKMFGGRMSLNLGAAATNEGLSKNFDYNKLESSISYAHSIYKSQLILGAETSRTRGKKMPFLKEIYTPLKTFIPGSGGGINQNNYSITPTNGLLSSVAGDTLGRTKVNWTIPVIESIEKHRFIFYFDRLDFSAFYNYGGAWNQSVLPPNSSRLKAAHGYNLDLQFENKGVKLSAGLGVGQLVGRPFEVFAKFSFDNFF